MADENLLAYASLSEAWKSFHEEASLLGQYADLLEKQILDGGDVLPSASKRYVTKTPRCYQMVPLYVARLVRSHEFRATGKLMDQEVENTLKRDQLHEIAFDSRNTEKSGPGHDVHRQAFGLNWFASNVARPGLRVLSGGAGSGKTYLVLFTVVELLFRWRHQRQRIPIVCAAEDILNFLPDNMKDDGAAAYKAGEDAEKLARCMVNAAMGRSWCQSMQHSAVCDRLVELILHGHAVVVVDGLDQVFSSCDRLAILLQKHAKDVSSGFLLAARPYALASILTEKFPLDLTFETLRWREHQISAFVACNGLTEAEPQALATLSRNPSTAEATAVPQLLAFVVSLLKDKKLQTVAEMNTMTRTQLYHRVITSRLEKVAQCNLSERVRRISDLALKEWRASQRNIRRLRGNPDTKGPFQDLVEAGLIGNEVRIDTETVEAEWSHRSILEFFVARGLVTQILDSKDPKASIVVLSNLGFDPGSHEILVFAYGELLNQAGTGTKLAQYLIELLSDGALDDASRTRLRAAFLLTSTLPPTCCASPSVVDQSFWARAQANWWQMPWISRDSLPRRLDKAPSLADNTVTENRCLAQVFGPLKRHEIFIRRMHLHLLNLWLKHDLKKAARRREGDAVSFASRAISIMGCQSGVGPLREVMKVALESSAWVAACEIAYCLQSLGDAGSGQPLIDANDAIVKSDEDKYLAHFAWCLTFYNTDDVRTCLLRTFDTCLEKARLPAACEIAISLDRIDAADAAVQKLELLMCDAATAKTWVVVCYLGNCPLLSHRDKVASALATVLDQAVQSSDWDVATRVCESLLQQSTFDGTRVVETFKSAYDNEAWSTVCEAATVLHMSAVDSIPVLAEIHAHLIDKELWLEEFYPCFALGRLGDVSVVPVLIRHMEYILDRYSVSKTKNIASALGRLGDQASVRPLIKALECACSQEDYECIDVIATALGRLGDSDAAEPMLLAFDRTVDLESHVNPSARLAAASISRAVASIGGDSAVEPICGALMSAVDQEDWYAAEVHISALEIMKDKRCVESLISALDGAMRKGGYNAGLYASMVLGMLDIDSLGSVLDVSSRWNNGRMRWSNVSVADCWWRGVSLNPAFGQSEMAGDEFVRRLPYAPGMVFRLFHALVRNLPSDQPRHWINGEFKKTSDLVVLDF